MTEEIRYIANLQRQEEFDNEVTELKDELKRLEQERDELKKACEKCKLFDIEKTNRDLLERIDELEQENKELKEINTALIQEAEDVTEARMEICNQCGNRDDYNIPCKMIRDLDYGLNITIEERDTYRSALEEIKEIVNQSCDNCKYNKDDITCSIGDCGEGKLQIIQNKINEVIGNETVS